MTLLQQPELLGPFPPAIDAPRPANAVEQALEEAGQLPSATQAENDIEQKMQAATRIFNRMDEDEDRYNLTPFVPDTFESIAPEDAYTTNAPRVLAEKTISFIAATEVIIRTMGSEKAAQQQEGANDAVEQLAIGMLNNSNRRLRRKQFGFSVHEALAWFATVRGRWTAARAILRKRPNGETYDDILPLDPRHLVIQQGDEEPIWAAYRMTATKSKVRDEYPNFSFTDSSQNNISEDDSIKLYEFYKRFPNPLFDVNSQNPFDRHPWVYLAGTVIDGQWARPLHNLFMLTFPVVAVPVSSRPMLTPSDGEGEQENEAHFGESIFAENRGTWETLNRSASYILDLTAKGSDPRTKATSLDGTFGVDDGGQEKGAEINLSSANDESVENFEEADVNRAAGLLLQILQQDSVAGGLPPQAFGLLDKPLSSVALRQLGNNLEHRILPRLRAVAVCIEGCLENLIAQYETGAFAPITVSGRRFDNHIFANRVINSQDISGHDPIIVKMDLALPEDQTQTWAVANMAMQPTVYGEPLASLEWVREKVLKMESATAISNQNLEISGKLQDPLSAAKEHVEAFIRDGDIENASIWFDRLTALSFQRQVETNTFLAQLQQLAQQIGTPLQPPPLNPNVLPQSTLGTPTIPGGSFTNQAANPANGAVPAVEFTGVGNQPSPEAGANTTSSRNRSGETTGLVDQNGNPILFS